MGRPPIGKTPMTGAERVRRYRLKHAAEQPAKPKDGRAGARIRALENENATLRRLLAETHVGATHDFSKTAQRKLDAAIRAHKKQLDREYDARRMAEIAKHLDRIMPELQAEKNAAWEEKQRYRKFMEAQEKIFTRDEYKQIVMCLHEDANVSADKRKQATQIFFARRFALTGEEK